MSASHRSGLDTGTGGEEVSDGIGGEREAEGLESLAEPGGAGLLGKGRRGDGGDGELEVGDVALVAGEPFEETVDARVGAEAFDILGERTGLSALGLPSNPGTEWHFRNAILCFQLLWNHNDTVLRVLYFGSHFGRTLAARNFFGVAVHRIVAVFRVAM